MCKFRPTPFYILNFLEYVQNVKICKSQIWPSPPPPGKAQIEILLYAQYAQKCKICKTCLFEPTSRALGRSALQRCG